MRYKIRDGIVYTTICGEHILISSVEARAVCPFLTFINETGALILKMIQDGNSVEEIINQIQKDYYNDSSISIGESVKSYISDLAANGYLTGGCSEEQKIENKC